MRYLIALLASLLLLLSCSGPRGGSLGKGPVLILQARRVVTLDPERPTAEAVAIRGDRIVAVGSAAELAGRFGGEARRVEVEGVLYPGLVDGHAHLASLGASLENVDLRDTRSLDELLARVKAGGAGRPAGSWILGRSWDQNLWPGKRLPDNRRLSALIPDHPVWLKRVDGHAGLANAKALALAGIGPDTPDPEGGKIHRHADGTPTGLLIDNAMTTLSKAVPKAQAVDLERQVLLAQKACLAAGLTRIHDAWTTTTVQRILRRLEGEGRWHLGVYGMHPTPAPGCAPALPDDPGLRATLRFRALKLFADGALGSRGAALLAPYSDDPGNRGLLTTPEAELRRLVREAARLGLQPCTHAIGDRANRLLLDIYGEELDAPTRARLRPRIEHAQVLHPNDLPRFADLGVLANMQPTHLTSDMPWVPTRLGAERTRTSYAFATLLRGGARISFGSDFPVERHAPLRGLFAAVTTRSPEAPDSPPLRPDQTLSPETALRGFTAEAAYAAFEEGVRGLIKPGYQADLTALDMDLLTDTARRIPGAKVTLTVVGGRICFRPAR